MVLFWRRALLPQRLRLALFGAAERTDEIEADERAAQPREILGGPPGTRTLDHRVKSPVLYQLS